MHDPIRDNPELADDIDSDAYRSLVASLRSRAIRAGISTEYRRGLSAAYEEAAEDLASLLGID